MTEGLLYLELFGQAHARSVPMVQTCSDLAPRDLFVSCYHHLQPTSTNLISHTPRNKTLKQLSGENVSSVLELRPSAVERYSLFLKANSAERLSHTSQQQQQQQKYNTLLQNKHSIGNHLRVTGPKFGWDLPCS
jgi:hypothetical protein